MSKPSKDQFETGAQRDSRTGKGRFDLISPFAEARRAKILEYGATNKAAGGGGYGAHNWEKGFPFCRTLDSVKRHLNRWLRQEPDNGHDDNLAAASFGIDCLMHFEEMIARGGLPGSLDDRPRYGLPMPDAPTKAPDVRRFQAGLEAALSGLPFAGEDVVGAVKVPARPRHPDDCGCGCNRCQRSRDRGGVPLRCPNQYNQSWAEKSLEGPPGSSFSKQLRIYVSGPFSAPTPELRRQNQQWAIDTGLALAKKGHLVHVPHAATGAWHGKLPYEAFMELDFSLIRNWATALYRISGASSGADREVTLAERLGLPVYRSFPDIPDGPVNPRLSTSGTTPYNPAEPTPPGA